MGLLDFLKAVAGICETRPLSPEKWSLEGQRARIDLARVPQLQQAGGAVYLKGQGLKVPVLLVRTEDERLLAFANRCTHLGHRKLDPVPGESILRCCSVNHSTYDYEGGNLSGPAQKPLTSYRVEQSGDEVVVDLSSG